MITALILCAHLTAAGYAKGCKSSPGPHPGVYAAVFQSVETGQSMVLIRRPSLDSFNQALLQVGGQPAASSPFARVIVAAPGSISIPGGIAWWVSTLETGCMAATAVNDLRTQIQTEEKNPAGVVNLKRLHDLGEELQAAEGDWANVSQAYKKGVGFEFPTVVCK